MPHIQFYLHKKLFNMTAIKFKVVYIFCYLFGALDALIFFDGDDSKVGSLLKQTPNIMRHNLRHIFIRKSKIVKAQSQQYSLAFWSGTLYKMEHTRLDDLFNTISNTGICLFLYEVQNQVFSFLGQRKPLRFN